jgi:hypothetical protein
MLNPNAPEPKPKPRRLASVEWSVVVQYFYMTLVGRSEWRVVFLA